MVVEKQVELFEAAFGVPFEPDDWTLSLSSVVVEEGEYSGTNGYGQPFSLSVAVAAPVSIRALDLDPAETASLTDGNFQFTGVVGSLNTELASFGITGLVISQENAGVGFDSRLIISYSVPQTGLLYDVEVASAILEPHPGETSIGSEFGDWYPVPYSCTNEPCAEVCDDVLSASLDQATQAFEDATGEAQSQYQTQLDLAHSQFDQTVFEASTVYNQAASTGKALVALELSLATVELTLATIACLATLAAWWTGGVLTAVCLAAAHARYAMAVVGAKSGLDGSVSDAKEILAFAKADASAQLNQELTNAQTVLEESVAWAQSELSDAHAAAIDEYEVCIGDCTEICIEWIWIPTIF